MGIAPEQRHSWDQKGFILERGFFSPAAVEAMTARVRAIVTAMDGGENRTDLIAIPEPALAYEPDPIDRLSKLFRVMRSETVFREAATDPRILALMGELIGDDVDCFLSQFIFKHTGALGQPWHQDDYYFRLSPLPQIGVWIACTAATLENGPLWVVPGSHREDIHDAVPDLRADSRQSYVEIVDADTSGEEVVLMEPGDVLVFHSHLRHRSTDNLSADMRAAMVYHYAPAKSVGHRAGNQDWVEVLRDGAVVAASSDPQPVQPD